MEAAKGILAFLACVFVAADCRSPFTVYQDINDHIVIFPSDSEHEEVAHYMQDIFDYIDTSHSNCEERRVTCWPIMHSESILSEVSQNMYTFVEHIDDLCTEIQHDSECLQWLDECFTLSQDHSRDHNLIVRLQSAEFICSERGRALLEEARNSLCYYTNAWLHAVHDLTRNCMSSLPEIQGVHYSRECQLLAQWTQCESQAATQECGSAIGTIFRELRDREDAIYYPNCTASSPSLEEDSRSSCVSNPEWFYDAFMLASSCMSTRHYSLEIGEYFVCQDIEVMAECLVDAATQLCGPPFGTLVRELINRNEVILPCRGGGHLSTSENHL
ncbi:hypothetical protein BsWGS_23401 [Bradybaena similaris]